MISQYLSLCLSLKIRVPKILTALLLTLFITACGTIPLILRPPISTNPAVVQLIDDAFWHIDHEQYELATSKLERALRVEPSSAALWFELAEVHLLQDDAISARNFAIRAKSLSRDSALSRDIDQFVFRLDDI